MMNPYTASSLPILNARTIATPVPTEIAHRIGLGDPPIEDDARPPLRYLTHLPPQSRQRQPLMTLRGNDSRSTGLKQVGSRRRHGHVEADHVVIGQPPDGLFVLVHSRPVREPYPHCESIPAGHLAQKQKERRHEQDRWGDPGRFGRRSNRGRQRTATACAMTVESAREAVVRLVDEHVLGNAR
jgi:hypothetical protein